MSVHAKPNSNAASPDVVVGDGKSHRKFPKAWGVALAGVLLVGVVVVGSIWLVHRHHNNVSSNKSAPTLNINTVDKNQSITNQAQGLALNGKVGDAQKLLDNSIAGTSDKATQGQLYEDKAQIAYSANDFTDGLQYAQKAESLHATANSASLIAQNAEALGNKSLALKYYKLELSRLSKPLTPSDKANQAALQAKITSLEQQ